MVALSCVGSFHDRDRDVGKVSPANESEEMHRFLFVQTCAWFCIPSVVRGLTFLEMGYNDIAAQTLSHNDSHSKYSDQPPPNDGGEEAPPGGLTDGDIDSNWEEAIETFDGMDLPEELLRGIYAYGFEKPSAIQQRAIQPTKLGRDLIAQAQSGTVSMKRWPGTSTREDTGMMIDVNHLSSLKRVIL